MQSTNTFQMKRQQPNHKVLKIKKFKIYKYPYPVNPNLSCVTKVMVNSRPENNSKYEK